MKRNNLIITCPACGFTFKNKDLLGKKKIKCPKCGYEFNQGDINPLEPKDFERRI